jgi:glycine/D-amino acid oxidase-like deaminating enzyme
VVVVGAGIVGASVAYHAARDGASVVLVDRSRPASGVTGDSFAWIRGEDWARLEREVAGVSVSWSGSLAWGEDTEPLGRDDRLVDAEEIARLEPNLRMPPSRAVYRPGDGAVDPVEVTKALVDATRRHGAEIRLGEEIRRLRVRDGAAVGVETATDFVACRTVVLAAGVGAVPLCAALGVELPVAASPARLLRFSGPPGLVRAVVSSPELDIRQTADGVVLVALAADAQSPRLDASFTGAEELRLVDDRAGMRPMPLDGLPIIGPLPGHPGGYLAVMHSGVRLAPEVGRRIAAELAASLAS